MWQEFPRNSDVHCVNYWAMGSWVHFTCLLAICCFFCLSTSHYLNPPPKTNEKGTIYNLHDTEWNEGE
jgi:hypothetical protein